MLGSGYTRRQQFSHLFVVKQKDSPNHFAYLSYYQNQCAIVLAEFGSTEYPGNITFDHIVPNIYLCNVDTVFLSSRIDQVIIETPSLSLMQIMENF